MLFVVRRTDRCSRWPTNTEPCTDSCLPGVPLLVARRTIWRLHEINKIEGFLGEQTALRWFPPRSEDPIAPLCYLEPKQTSGTNLSQPPGLDREVRLPGQNV
jgi:hypothetical protein